MAATVDPNTPQSNTSAQPQSFVQKNNAGASQGLPGEGNPIAATADANGQQYVVIASSVIEAATTAALTSYFTMLDNQLRDIKRILALMAIYQGVEIPDELADIFADDVAA